MSLEPNISPQEREMVDDILKEISSWNIETHSHDSPMPDPLVTPPEPEPEDWSDTQPLPVLSILPKPVAVPTPPEAVEEAPNTKTTHSPPAEELSSEISAEHPADAEQTPDAEQGTAETTPSPAISTEDTLPDETISAEEVLIPFAVSPEEHPQPAMQGSPIPKKAEKPPTVWQRIVRFALELPKAPVPPDLSPKELSKLYTDKTATLRMQKRLAWVCAILLFLLAILPKQFPEVLPEIFRQSSFLLPSSLILFVLCLVCCHSILWQGIKAFLKLSPDFYTMSALASLAVLVDGLLLQFHPQRDYTLPLFAPLALVLATQLWGQYLKTDSTRLHARLAATTSQPDVLTIEPSQWNGKAVYRRHHMGTTAGFGTQIQSDDGASLRFRALGRLFFPLALLAGLLPLFAGQSWSVLPWSFSAVFTATATLSASLSFALPFRALSIRLAKSGIALAGWAGIQDAKSGLGLLLDGYDFFPEQKISLKSYEIFDQDFPPVEIFSVTASLLHASDACPADLFFEATTERGGQLFDVSELQVDSEGIRGVIHDKTVLLGTVKYLLQHNIDVPSGLNVPMAMFCAVGGQFSAQFVLHYHLHKYAPAALELGFLSRLVPIFTGMDSNFTSQNLRKLFSLPWERIALPDLAQRHKLRQSPRNKDAKLLALLCRFDILTLTTAVVGAKRLRSAVRLCTAITCFASLMGLLLSTYLVMTLAFHALSAMGLSLFMLAWCLPVLLIAGWVNQF